MFANQHPSSKSNAVQQGTVAIKPSPPKRNGYALFWLLWSQDTCKCQPSNTPFTFSLTTIVQCEYMPGRAPGSGEALPLRSLCEEAPQRVWSVHPQANEVDNKRSNVVDTSLDARAAWNSPLYNGLLRQPAVGATIWHAASATTY